ERCTGGDCSRIDVGEDARVGRRARLGQRYPRRQRGELRVLARFRRARFQRVEVFVQMRLAGARNATQARERSDLELDCRTFEYRSRLGLAQRIGLISGALADRDLAVDAQQIEPTGVTEQEAPDRDT